MVMCANYYWGGGAYFRQYNVTNVKTKNNVKYHYDVVRWLKNAHIFVVVVVAIRINYAQMYVLEPVEPIHEPN